MPASSSAHLTLRSRTSPCANGGTDLNALTLIILTFLLDALIPFSPTSVTFARRGVAPQRSDWGGGGSGPPARSGRGGRWGGGGAWASASLAWRTAPRAAIAIRSNRL